jgi:poly-gamma-glutamate capsule biosynthesis protein CapA/YwtB (metallophosphatase superfamily)
VALTLALAGDTMLGRGVGERLAANPRVPLLAAQLQEIARDADLFVLNLECCISDRGERIRLAEKPFFFRAPPVAAERLAEMGVTCVTLANNHALDFGPDALEDTLVHLRAAGIAHAGAGPDEAAARAPVVLEGGGLRVRVVSVTDHPSAFAAGDDRPGVAFADLWRQDLPDWLCRATAPGLGADVVVVAPHWGPNMRAEPVAHVRRAAAALDAAGATLVAGHSAHIPQGVSGRTLFDLGDFIDDYAVARERNDLGLLFFVTLDKHGPIRLEAVPLKLEYCHTRLADSEEADSIRDRFRVACAALGTDVADENGRFVVVWR